MCLRECKYISYISSITITETFPITCEDRQCNNFRTLSALSFPLPLIVIIFIYQVPLNHFISTIYGTYLDSQISKFNACQFMLNMRQKRECSQAVKYILSQHAHASPIAKILTTVSFDEMRMKLIITFTGYLVKN